MTPESKKRLFWWLILLVVGAVVALFVSRPLLRAYRDHQALQEVAQARDLLASGDTEGALEVARAAYRESPENPEVVRAVAQIYDGLDAGLADDFWAKAFELSGNDSDLSNWVGAALRVGDFETVAAQLPEMEARGLTGSAYHYYKGRLLLQQQDMPAALTEARTAIEPNVPDERAQFFFFELTQLSDDPVLRKEGMDYLWRLARSPDEVGLRALKRLTAMPAINDAERLEIISRLESHPMPEREERLLALRLRYQLAGADVEANLESAKELFQLDNALEQAELGRWLNAQGRYEQTLGLISAEQAFARKDLFLVRLDALAQLGRWDAIARVLDQPQVPLDTFLKYLYLARVGFETGDVAQGEIAWERAVSEALNDVDELWYLVSYARRLGLNREAAKALWRLAQLPSQEARAAPQLLHLYQVEHDTVGMQQVLDLMRERYPDNLSVLNDWAYVNLLRNERVEESLRVAQRVVRESPSSFLARYVTLALGYYRSGDPAEALATLEPLEVNWLELPAKWRVVYAAILRANGQYVPASQLLRGIDPADLLPQELALAHETARF